MHDDPKPRSDAHVLGVMLFAALAAWAVVFAIAAWDINSQIKEGKNMEVNDTKILVPDVGSVNELLKKARQALNEALSDYKELASADRDFPAENAMKQALNLLVFAQERVEHGGGLRK